MASFVENFKASPVVHFNPGETLHFSIDISISSDITVDLNEFKKGLEAYARKLILRYGH